jgi:hypothetical protein
MGLFKTIFNAREEQDLKRRDALLEELRTLARAHPDDTRMSELLKVTESADS